MAVGYPLLLNVIDALRKRKARPSLDNIISSLCRKHGRQQSDAIETLRHAIADQVVIKVSYKDGISYRNANRVTRGKKALRQELDSAGPIRKYRLLLAVKRATKAYPGQGSPGHLVIGSTLEHIRKDMAIDEPDGFVGVADEVLRSALDIQVSLGILYKITADLYIVRHEHIELKVDLSEYDPAVYELDSACSTDDVELSSQPSPMKEPGRKRSATTSPQAKTTAAQSRKMKRINTDDSSSSGSQVRGRPASQRKKIKKSLGPDFLDPSELGLNYLREAYQPKCDYCGLKNFSNGDLVQCSSCPFRSHVTCYKKEHPTESLTSYVKGVWKCSICQSKCSVCKKNGFSDVTNVICSACDKSFHLDCADLDEEPGPDEQWRCKDCEDKDPKPAQSSLDSLSISYQKDEVDGSAAVPEDDNEGKETPPPPLEPLVIDTKSAEVDEVADEADGPVEQQQQQQEQQPDSNDQPEMVVVEKSPTGSDSSSAIAKNVRSFKKERGEPITWSVSDVEEYVVWLGFDKEALIFREQEIDGRSLLLLKRNDVLSGLSLKLGPAIKLYTHISCLQQSDCSQL